MKTLENKVALVTGSSRGIGAEIARTLGRAGARVVVNYAGKRAEAEKVVAEIAKSGSEAIAVQADVSKPADVKRLFDEAIRRFGKLDILINNAGVVLYKKIEETADEEFDRVIQVNVKGVFTAMREAATRLEKGGRIVNFSSTVTRLMLPTYATYSASKAAVEELTRVFAKEIGTRGITVNSVSPGPTRTDMFLSGKTEEQVKRMAGMAALGRIGEPEDIAKVVLFLVSDEAGWVNGQNIAVNGGVA